MTQALFPYLVRVRFPKTPEHAERESTLVVFSEIRPNYLGGGYPADYRAFLEEAKKLISEKAIVVRAEMMVWAMDTRAVYLDDSADAIKKYLA